MSRRFTPPSFLCLSVLTLGVAAGCGGAVVGSAPDAAAQGLDVDIDPPAVAVSPGGTSRFAAAVTGTSVLGVTWVVDESGGGTISSTGLYQAPAQAGTFHVRAVSVADPTVSGSAQVTVTSGSSSGGSSGGGSATAPCANTSLRTTGTVYYYCDCQSGSAAGCAAGNDANVGTSATAPRRSFADAVTRFNAMKAGDTIAFCRGGAFAAAGGTFRNPSCTASNTCDFRDYTPTGLSTAARPIFAAGTGTFVALSGSGIQKQGYRFWNLDVRHSGSGYTFNIGDSSTDIDICNVAMADGDIGVLEQTTNQRISLRYSTISRYTTDGFLGGSNGLVIDSNVFTDCGIFTDNRSHSIYIQGGIEQTPDGYHDLKITNNDIVGTSAGTCVGTVFTASGRNHDLLVENNRITMAKATGGCYGFIVAHGFYPYGCWHYRAKIRRNRVIIPGGYVGVAAGVCVDCQITDNVIAVDTAYDAQRPLVIPESPWRSSQGDVQSSGAVIQNNTIYQASSTSVTPAYSGVVITEGTGHVIENNAVFTGGSSSSCYDYSGTTRASNNYCRSSGGASVALVFANAGASDFRPAAGSPLIGYGSSSSYSATALSPTWSQTDAGVTRTAPIDAGAFVH